MFIDDFKKDLEEMSSYKYGDTVQQCQLSIVPLEFSGDDIARIRFFKGGK